jgi:phospholipase/lecithinase/hemolysin
LGCLCLLKSRNQPKWAVSTKIRFIQQRLFTNEIAALAKTGAKIYILNIPDLGLIPLGLSTSDGGALLSNLTIIFNKGIAGLAKVKNISLVDSNALMAQLLSANQFDTTEIYCPAIIDPTHICGDSLTNPELVNSPQVPYFFADPIHPSFAAHKVIGQAIQKLIHKKTQ